MGEPYDLEDLLQRQRRFNHPPASMLDELLKNNDGISDKWDPECQGSIMKEEACKKTQPIIGILTQPVPDSKREKFDYKEYILEVNDNFIRWAGSKTVAIPYNITEEALIKLLGQINGVLFTGGALTLVPDIEKPHPYYKTAKRIFRYA